MQVQHHASFESLAREAAAWDRLTRGVPFRGWDWQTNWWKHFAAGRELCVVTVRDDAGELIGIAPWFAERSSWRGNTLQFLGVGEVCSDYLSLLTLPEHADEVATAIARWLEDANAGGSDPPADRGWDLLQLSSVAKSDCVVPRLVDALVDCGNQVHRRDEVNCWRITFPAAWQDFEMLLSKSHRKQIRRLQHRLLDTGRAILKTAESPQDLDRGMKILEQLHQQRRQQFGQAGCFSNPSFSAFLKDVAAAFLQSGKLQLHWVEVDGHPVAAEFQLRGTYATYAYQAGIDPSQLDLEPGRLITLATVKKAFDQGQQAFDFLRGDESYKPHWRAEPRPLVEIRVVAKSGMSRIRNGLWLASDTVKNMVKRSLNLEGMH